MPQLKIVIACSEKDDSTHLNQEIFKGSALFVPVQGGRAIAAKILPITGDDTGYSISGKNPFFAELTSYYWAWKNLKTLYPETEYIGFCHYRRYFAADKNSAPLSFAYLCMDKIPKMEAYTPYFIKSLQHADIILMQPEVYPSSLIKQFPVWINEKDIYCVKDIIHKLYPEYDYSFEKVFNNNKASLKNMFISRWDFMDKYFNWLFPILFLAEQNIESQNYSGALQRTVAILAELLLNVYVYHNKYKYVYNKIFLIDPENRFNYPEGFYGTPLSRKIFFWKRNIVYNLIFNLKKLKNMKRTRFTA